MPSRALNQFLPIVERELRALSHHALTWWRRLWTVAVAILIFTCVVLTTSSRARPAELGQNVFIVLSGCAMVYVLFAGPLRTADCLSRERREGTLGLLFLTNLSSFDVVAGKMAATSLETVFRLVAALPLVAIPFLMGGINLVQFATVVIALLNLLFLSLAVGVAVSAFCVSGRAAFALTFLLLAVLTLAIPFIGEEVLGIRVHSNTGAIFYMFSPLYTMELCINRVPLRTPWKYWLNLGAIHSLAWFSLWLACWRTKDSWRDQPHYSPWLAKWTKRFWPAQKKADTEPGSKREPLLAGNPISWLEGRDRFHERALWALLVIFSLPMLVAGQLSRRAWPDDEFVVLWSLLAHYTLCIWIAVQAPRRLADDKQSGALELLLSTALRPAEILRGLMQVWRRRFGGPLLVLLSIDLLLVNAFFHAHPHSRNANDDMLHLAVCGLIVFPLQAWTLGRFGIYAGLVSGNSLRATFWSLGAGVVLPWLLFFGSIFTCEIGRRTFRFLPRINDEIAFNLWIASHMAPFMFLLLLSANRLQFQFRALAAQSTPGSWWKRH